MADTVRELSYAGIWTREECREYMSTGKRPESDSLKEEEDV